MQQNNFEKKIAIIRGMLIEQVFELREPGPPGRICILVTVCFHDQTIISKENFRVNCYSLLKYSRRQCALFPLTWAKSLTKFNPKMQDFKRVGLKLQVKGGLNNLIFSIGFQMLKI